MNYTSCIYQTYIESVEKLILNDKDLFSRPLQFISLKQLKPEMKGSMALTDGLIDILIFHYQSSFTSEFLKDRLFITSYEIYEKLPLEIRSFFHYYQYRFQENFFYPRTKNYCLIQYTISPFFTDHTSLKNTLMDLKKKINSQAYLFLDFYQKHDIPEEFDNKNVLLDSFFKNTSHYKIVDEKFIDEINNFYQLSFHIHTDPLLKGPSLLENKLILKGAQSETKAKTEGKCVYNFQIHPHTSIKVLINSDLPEKTYYHDNLFLELLKRNIELNDFMSLYKLVQFYEKKN